jgi:glycosyltransferase involved in cell wall biosynthesis
MSPRWTEVRGPRLRVPQADAPATSAGGAPAVLSIVDTIEIGGAGKVVLQSTRGLVSRGTRVVLANFCYPGRTSAFDAAGRDAGAEVVVLEQAHRADYGCIDGLRALASSRGVGLVESHSLKAHVVAWRLARTLRLPWLAYVHGWTAESRRVRLYNALERRLLRAPDHVCAVAPPLAVALRAAGRVGPITVLSNALEPSPRMPTAAERVAARAALGVHPDATLVVAVGRLSREKGVDVLLDALGRTEQASLTVLVAGDGPERASLEAQAGRGGLASRVRWLGQRRDVRDLYAAADAVAIPSRSEGLPNVVLEAADAATPVIATRVGALPDVVRDGHSGWLVAPDDAAALAAALDDAARAMDRRERGVRLRRHVLESYSAERRLDALVALHERVRTEAAR